MSEPQWLHSDEALGEVVRATFLDIEFPPTPNFAASFEQAVGPDRAGRGRGMPRGLVAALLILVAAIALVAALPGARRAVADLFGLTGISIQVAPGALPATEAHPELNLGAVVTAAEAEAEYGPLAVPRSEEIGEPEQILLGTTRGAQQITLVYAASTTLPETDVRGVGALLTQFRGEQDEVVFSKQLSSGRTQLNPVEVDGAPGYWLNGAPHTVILQDPDGTLVEERARLARNVLLWEKDGVTYRLEADVTLRHALRIAESIR